MPYSGNKVNRPKLRALMAKHELSPPKVASLLGRKVSTVHTWLSVSGVDVPDHAIELLGYKLGGGVNNASK